MFREGIIALALVLGTAAAPRRSPGTRVPATSTAGILKPRLLYSPDRRCAVRITHEDGDVNSVQCLRVSG